MKLSEKQIALLKSFMENTAVSNAVYDKLLDTFLSYRSNDVSVLAASRIAIDLLREAWQELSTMQGIEKTVSELKQIGM